MEPSAAIETVHFGAPVKVFGKRLLRLRKTVHGIGHVDGTKKIVGKGQRMDVGELQRDIVIAAKSPAGAGKHTLGVIKPDNSADLSFSELKPFKNDIKQSARPNGDFKMGSADIPAEKSHLIEKGATVTKLQSIPPPRPSNPLTPVA